MIFYLRKHLTEVNLSQTNFDDLNFFGLLKNCTNLKHINISDNHKLSDLFSKLNENDFNTIKGNIKVLSLNLSYCSNLSSNSLHNFEKIFMKLEQLNLEGNSSMNYNSLNVISNLMELKSINITGLNYEENGDIHFVSSKIQDFIVCLSKVEQFNLKFCPKFNGDCLSLVSACWNELTFLDITCNSQARISHFEDLIVGCSKLKTLLIGSCPGVSDEVVYKLVKNLKYLETLDISKNLSITDKSVKLISKLGASLKELSLSKCQNINGQSLKFLVFRKCGVSLKFLDISGLPNITNETITQLYTLSPNITLVSKL
ncbi:hypothetical protein HK099_005029 [Clydaea vesicula]|uniref:RNI-like protein n=1 Tax=Clydaea vesicula TaxID=447962 RepID=A0AAD5TZV7_9FUNG|nr:hypothetical protein HK099_005029 [Clydaea vesicula]